MTEKRPDRVTIADLVRSGLATSGDKWIIRRGGSGGAKDVEGEVTGDGNLRVVDQEFRSVSEAARQALGTNTNGWKRWSYFDGQGWIHVDQLRRAYKERHPGTDG